MKLLSKKNLLSILTVLTFLFTFLGGMSVSADTVSEDWDVNNGAAGVTGNATDGFVFESGTNHFARYKNGIDLELGIEMKLENLEAGKWYYLAFSGEGAFDFGGELPADWTTPASRIYIITLEADGNLLVQLWGAGNAISLDRYAAFDKDANHLYKFVLGEDNHYRLQIDEKLFSADAIDQAGYTAMMNGTDGAVLTIGSSNPLKINVQPVVKEEDDDDDIVVHEDWIMAENKFEITGSFKDGYSFNTGSDGLFATLNKKIDASLGVKMKIKPDSDGWFYIGFGGENAIDVASPLAPSADENPSKIYIMSMQGKHLLVQLWNGSATVNLAHYKNFDVNAEHVFKYVKGEDNLWRFFIDDVDFGADAVDENNFKIINDNGNGSYITLGSASGVSVSGMIAVTKATDNGGNGNGNGNGDGNGESPKPETSQKPIGTAIMVLLAAGAIVFAFSTRKKNVRN